MCQRSKSRYATFADLPRSIVSEILLTLTIRAMVQDLHCLRFVVNGWLFGSTFNDEFYPVRHIDALIAKIPDDGQMRHRPLSTEFMLVTGAEI
jgi:hypothetical protein